MLLLQAHVGCELARLKIAEQQRKAARREMGRLASALSRRDSPTSRETSPKAVRFPLSRPIGGHPDPVAA